MVAPAHEVVTIGVDRARVELERRHAWRGQGEIGTPFAHERQAAVRKGIEELDDYAGMPGAVLGDQVR